MNRVELFYRLNRLPELVFLGSKQDARHDRHDLYMYVGLAGYNYFICGIPGRSAMGSIL